jgi:hypothetical protein
MNDANDKLNCMGAPFQRAIFQVSRGNLNPRGLTWRKMAEFWFLGDRGVSGSNSDAVAKLVLSWVEGA